MSVTLTNTSLSLTTALPLTGHPARVYLSSLSPGSQRTMRQALDAIASLLTNNECDADTLDWAALTYQHTAAVQAALLEINAPATVKKKMAALRGVLTVAKKLKLMNPEDFEAAVDLPKIKNHPLPRGRALTQTEITALIKVCTSDTTNQGARDKALIGILRGTGLRRAEVVKLEVRDFDGSTGALEVRQGKGGKDRTVYLPENAIAFVDNWLNTRGHQPGALLCPILKGGQIQNRKMTPPAV
ncbi:tyrosine-type recombinase/integrase [Moorena sp. SIO3H5]|uniref:tyrosine-type recombinase/integrase n=1 Tax=Moorena sp. SIO3H5 TaxID=2607834 RepID=UPI0013B689F8|nr:tyrosine-type recombinase/integrase [Moorena sp. SIO3H5]NEO74667.1 tyrosine-type recombinase/integrase [Moorena sp. SIO3H5]